jgi:hypothetical protein
MAGETSTSAPFLSSPPDGFLQATEAVSSLSMGELELLAQRVSKFLLQRNGSLSLDDIAMKAYKLRGMCMPVFAISIG